MQDKHDAGGTVKRTTEDVDRRQAAGYGCETVYVKRSIEGSDLIVVLEVIAADGTRGWVVGDPREDVSGELDAIVKATAYPPGLERRVVTRRK